MSECNHNWSTRHTYGGSSVICTFCGEKANHNEIRKITHQRETERARVAELKHLCERLQHCAQGFYVDQGDYGHMEAIMRDYHAIMRGAALERQSVEGGDRSC